MFAAIRNDLLDFCATIKEDTTSTLNKVLGTEEADEAEEEKTLREKLIADTRRSYHTYSQPVEEQYELQYETYFRKFSLGSHGAEIAELLDAEVDVSRYYAELVPAQIRPEDFWARYFFRLMLVSSGGVLSLEDDDEEELVWDSEEKDDTNKATVTTHHGPIHTTMTPQASSEVSGLRSKVGVLEGENQRLRGQVKTLAGRVAQLERLILSGTKEAIPPVPPIPSPTAPATSPGIGLTPTNSNRMGHGGGSPPRPGILNVQSAHIATPASSLTPTAVSSPAILPPTGMAVTVSSTTVKTRQPITFPTRVATVTTSPGNLPGEGGEEKNTFASISTSPRGAIGGAVPEGRVSSYSSTGTTFLGTRMSGATTTGATGESNHGSVSPLTEVTEANTRRNKLENLHVSGRLNAETGGFLRRISDNVSECTSEQEQSHSNFVLSESATADTEGGAHLPSYSSSMEVHQGGGSAVSFVDEDSEGSGVLVAGTGPGAATGTASGTSTSTGTVILPTALLSTVETVSAVSRSAAVGAVGESRMKSAPRSNLATLDDDEDEDGWG